MSVLTLDFETHPIEKGGDIWPKPVGYAYKIDGARSGYRAFGHPTGNNTTESGARQFLARVLREAKRVRFFNAPFDVGVGRWMGVKVPWSKVDDVQIKAFLADPYAQPRDQATFAHVHLGLHEDEHTAALHAWIRANVKGAKSKKKLGEFYYLAPGDLVGKKSRGDVDRTAGLDRVFTSMLGGSGRWGEAYRRELDVLPVLERMTIEGVPLDADALAKDIVSWGRRLEKVEAYLCRALGTDLDINKRNQVCDAMEKAGLVREWILTDADERSTSYENLDKLASEGLADRAFVEAYSYRNLLAWQLRTFITPWAAAGEFFHPRWNSVKGEGFGAVTGRFSSNPNVQNVANDPPPFKVPRGWPPLPKLRKYIRAPKGYTLVGCDISQQELRILAHFAGDPLRTWYRENPKLDLHVKVAEQILAVTGIDVGRGAAKTLNLAGIYGQGIAALSRKLKIEEERGRELRAAHRVAVPGVQRWTRKLAAQQSFETAGGRPYLHDPERPYKSGNTEIQGSAADQLKRVMIEVDAPLRAIDSRLVLTAHDELLSLAPKGRESTALRIMTESIAATGWPHEGSMFDVPMLSEGYVGETWE